MRGFALVAHHKPTKVVHPGVDTFDFIAVPAHLVEFGCGITLPTLASAFTLGDRGFDSSSPQVSTQAHSVKRSIHCEHEDACFLSSFALSWNLHQRENILGELRLIDVGCFKQKRNG